MLNSADSSRLCPDQDCVCNFPSYTLPGAKTFFMNQTMRQPVQVVAISLSAVANIVLNSLVMVVIARTPTLREDRTTLFMFSLAASDLVFGVCIMITSAVVCSHPEIRLDEIMPVLLTIAAWLVLTSVYNMCSVSLCKMLAVVYPLRYLALVTEKRCYFVIVWNWTASFILTAPIYFIIDAMWSEDMCFVRMEKATSANTLVYLFVSQVMGGFLSIVLMVYANVRMFIVVVHARRKVAAETSPSGQLATATFHYGGGNNACVLQQHTLSVLLIRSLKSSKNIIIICSVFVSIMIMQAIVEFTVSLHERQRPSGTEIVVMWLFFNNSSLNSLLYIVLHRSVRSALMNLFH